MPEVKRCLNCKGVIPLRYANGVLRPKFLRYCSRSCYGEAKVGSKKVEPIPLEKRERRHCKQCGKEISIFKGNTNQTYSPFQYAKRVFCSYRCSGSSRVKEPIRETCSFCKKEFQIVTKKGGRFTPTRKRRYCSQDCYHEARKQGAAHTKEIDRCAVCDTAITSDSYSSVVCSIGCSFQYRTRQKKSIQLESKPVLDQPPPQLPPNVCKFCRSNLREADSDFCLACQP